jgi:hypothetical protein
MIFAFSFGERVVNHLARRLRVSALKLQNESYGGTDDFALPRQQDEITRSRQPLSYPLELAAMAMAMATPSENALNSHSYGMKSTATLGRCTLGGLISKVSGYVVIANAVDLLIVDALSSTP